MPLHISAGRYETSRTIVSYNREAVRPDMVAALPNVFIGQTLIAFVLFNNICFCEHAIPMRENTVLEINE
jgi:hypothetical protein